MKKLNIITILLLFFAFTNCVNEQAQNSLVKVENSMREVSDKLKIKLSYEIVISDSKEQPFTITIYEPIKLNTSIGLLLLECYESLKKENLFYDVYILKDKNKNTIAEMYLQDLEKVALQKQKVDSFIKGLKEKNKDQISALVHSSQFNEQDINQMIEHFHNTVPQTEEKFIGFELGIDNGTKFSLIAYQIKDKNIVITYDFEDDKNLIFGITF